MSTNRKQLVTDNEWKPRRTYCTPNNSSSLLLRLEKEVPLGSCGQRTPTCRWWRRGNCTSSFHERRTKRLSIQMAVNATDKMTRLYLKCAIISIWYWRLKIRTNGCWIRNAKRGMQKPRKTCRIKIAKQSVAHLSPFRTHYKFVSAPAKLNSQVPDVYIFDTLDGESDFPFRSIILCKWSTKENARFFWNFTRFLRYD